MGNCLGISAKIDSSLSNTSGGPQPLSWDTRIKVAIGAAKGLCFLHEAEQQVIYRDFKASNILLDALSDFDLAKAGPTGDRTHVSTQVMGTQGNAAPEYVATGRLTTKSDIYSFVVVLLELLSGRCAVDVTKTDAEQNLVEWTVPYMRDKRKLFRIMGGHQTRRPIFSERSIHCGNFSFAVPKR